MKQKQTVAMSISDKCCAEMTEKCLRLLARREYSQAELRQKLAAFPAAAVQKVLADLAAKNLQSDERFAQSYVRSHVARGQGRIKIQHALSGKGIAATLIADALAETDWEELAARVYHKKYPLPAENMQEAAKRQRFMAQRGFTFAEIQAATRRHR